VNEISIQQLARGTCVVCRQPISADAEPCGRDDCPLALQRALGDEPLPEQCAFCGTPAKGLSPAAQQRFCTRCGRPFYQPCPTCGELIVSGGDAVRHCPRCGILLRTCAACGRPYPPGATYCEQAGCAQRGRRLPGDRLTWAMVGGDPHQRRHAPAALSADPPAVIWRTQASGGPLSPPIVGAGCVWAVDAGDGKRRAQVRVAVLGRGREAARFSAPAFATEVTLATVGVRASAPAVRAHDCYVAGGDARIYRIGATWRRDRDMPLSLHLSEAARLPAPALTPLITRGPLLAAGLGSGDVAVHDLDAATTAIIETGSGRALTMAPAIASEDMLLQPLGDALYLIRLEDRSCTAWVRVGSPICAGPVALPGREAWAVGDLDGTVHVIDARGAEVATLPRRNAGRVRSIASWNDGNFAVCYDDVVLAVSRDGRQAIAMQVDDLNGALVATEQGGRKGVIAAAGARIYRGAIGQAPVTSPELDGEPSHELAMAGGLLFATTQRGAIYCLR